MIYLDNASTMCPRPREAIVAVSRVSGDLGADLFSTPDRSWMVLRAPEAHGVGGTLETGVVRLSIGRAAAEADEAGDARVWMAGKHDDYWFNEGEGHHAR